MEHISWMSFFIILSRMSSWINRDNQQTDIHQYREYKGVGETQETWKRKNREQPRVINGDTEIDQSNIDAESRWHKWEMVRMWFGYDDVLMEHDECMHATLALRVQCPPVMQYGECSSWIEMVHHRNEMKGRTMKVEWIWSHGDECKVMINAWMWDVMLCVSLSVGTVTMTCHYVPYMNISSSICCCSLCSLLLLCMLLCSAVCGVWFCLLVLLYNRYNDDN